MIHSYFSGGDPGQLSGRGAVARPQEAPVLRIRRKLEVIIIATAVLTNDFNCGISVLQGDLPAREHAGRRGRPGLLRGLLPQREDLNLFE